MFKKNPKQKAISKARHKLYYRFRFKQAKFYGSRILASLILLGFAFIPLSNCYSLLTNVTASANITSKQIWAAQESVPILLAMWIVASIAAFMIISHLNWSYDKHLKKIKAKLPESSWKTYRETAFKKADKLADEMLAKKQANLRASVRKAEEPYEKKIKKLKEQASQKAIKPKKKNKKKHK